jgi:hypothetical protein
MGRETCDTLKNFENPPEIGGFASQTLRKGATSPRRYLNRSKSRFGPDLIKTAFRESSSVFRSKKKVLRAPENSIFWDHFRGFVTFLAHSKIPSVIRDRFENFLKFSAL